MPALTPGVRPKSSALTIRRLSMPESFDDVALDRARQPGRRRHLRRIRADEIEALVADGIPAVAEARVDGDAVERGVDADRVDRARHDVGGRDACARARREDRREAEPGADFEDALAGSHV